jgi:ABC-type cobalamin/Fe3+-siderophores transport system ATPase subunit
MHDLSLAMRFGDNAMVMKDGETRAFGKPGEILTAELLEYVYEMDVAGYMTESLKMWNGIKA